MSELNPVFDPLRRKMVSGPEAGQNVSVDGFEVNFIGGGTGSALYNAVAPIDLTGSTFSLTLSSVRDILTGAPVVEAIDVAALRGALSAGQAVDVTSQPDGVTGDYKGTFTVTGSTLGFASFPKYASGLNYLFIADLTATASGTVAPAGAWLDGTTAAKSLGSGIPTRVAMLFDAASKAKFTFTSTGEVEVSHCREYEVTACSAEAVAYIAQLADPDAFAAYYLIKPDMVQPWTRIIDMGSSPAVTIASGLSYKLNAATGAHQLTVDACPAGYDGRDAMIRITLGGSGVIQAVPPLQLGAALTPYAINNCVVRFRDGEAVLLVEDTLAGYIVNLTSGTGEGSLPYGLAAAGVPYIAFSPSTDGIPIDLSGATTAAEEVTVVGNGYEETILTGAIACTSKTTVANLALSDVGIVGGTLTLGDAYIPAGSTVAVSGGGLAIEKIVGEGSASVIDLGGTNMVIRSGTTASASGCTLTSGAHTVIQKGANVIFDNCAISRNANNIYVSSATLTLNNCTVSGNLGDGNGKDVALSGNATVTINGGILGSMSGTGATNAYLAGAVQVDQVRGTGSAIISGGAVVTLGSRMSPDGGITILAGGCVINGVNLAETTTPHTSIINSGGQLYVDGTPVE